MFEQLPFLKQHYQAPNIMRYRFIPILLLLLLASCDKAIYQAPLLQEPEESLLFAFYNLENLWDASDDPANPGDDDFTPRGTMKWTEERYERKLAAIARAIRSIDDNRGPDIIGLCELENAAVLHRLVGEFLGHDYAIIHEESRDSRGIDVALLVRHGVAAAAGFTMHPVDLGPGSRPTRDILEVPLVKDGRKFTVLVNHWPSRRGGEAQSSPLRERAAAVAARVIDSLTRIDPDADIVLMGDLNDEPENRSVRDVLDARAYTDRETFRHRLINTAAPVAYADSIGSYYYRGDWETIDQIMLSRGVLDAKGLVLYQTAETVFAPEFLRDSRADPIARPPHRTYIRGTQYIAGTSDHFPVYLRVGWGSAELP